MLCDSLEGWDEGWEGGSRSGGMYVYLRLIQIAGWQKPPQHSITIILQLKINFKGLIPMSTQNSQNTNENT